MLVLGGVLTASPAGAGTVTVPHAATTHHASLVRNDRPTPAGDRTCGPAQQARILLSSWLYSLTGAARYRTTSTNQTCVATSLALRAATTPDPPPPTAPSPPAPGPSPSTPAAPASAPLSAPAVITAGSGTSGFGCAAALSYLSTHAAPGYQLVCPGYAQGHEGMTCDNWPSICPGQKEIVISDPCPVSYMNEASNSLVFSHLSTAPIDPYGYACPG